MICSRLDWERGVKVAVGASGCPGSCRDEEGAGWNLGVWQQGMDVLRETMVLYGVISTPRQGQGAKVTAMQSASQLSWRHPKML